LALAALIAVLGLVGWELLRDFGKGGAERAQPGQSKVEVPAVKGLATQEARGRLVEAGFGVGVRPRENPEVDASIVLEQSVAGGKRADKGSKILLTVGEGPRVAKIPDLVGLTYEEAEGELQRAGLLLQGVKQVPSETVPAGVIVAQDPPPGTGLEPDSYVYLTTSIGPAAETTSGY
jgi:serine/threonine-protein kinase